LEQKLRPFGINAGKIDTSNPCVPCREKIEPFLFGGISPPNKKSFLRVLCDSAVEIVI
jgi:hypothetical protein